MRQPAVFFGHGSPMNALGATDEHHLPLLYVAAQQNPGETVRFFNDMIEGGSISMTGARIG